MSGEVRLIEPKTRCTQQTQPIKNFCQVQFSTFSTHFPSAWCTMPFYCHPTVTCKENNYREKFFQNYTLLPLQLNYPPLSSNASFTEMPTEKQNIIYISLSSFLLNRLAIVHNNLSSGIT